MSYTKIVTYKTEDGALFESEEAAILHSERLDLEEAFDKTMFANFTCFDNFDEAMKVESDFLNKYMF